MLSPGHDLGFQAHPIYHVRPTFGQPPSRNSLQLDTLTRLKRSHCSSAAGTVGMAQHTARCPLTAAASQRSSASTNSSSEGDQQQREASSEPSTTGWDTHQRVRNGNNGANRGFTVRDWTPLQLDSEDEPGQYAHNPDKGNLRGTILKVIGALVVELRMLPYRLGKFSRFAQEAFSQREKLSYPSPVVILRLTIAVLVVSAVLTLLVYGLDSGFEKLLQPRLQ